MQDDTMSDHDAELYLKDLQAHEMHVPADERQFLRQNGPTTNAFLRAYGYFAASIAQSWYKHNTGLGTTIGECIRVANTGLVLASYRYLKANPTVPCSFKNFASPFIRAELDWLLYKGR